MMNELRGKYINVVLGVEDGRGMEFLKHPVYIIAHFNGRIMESDYVNPSPTPDFNTELVWETEKKVIRNVRSTNSPLRVECYGIDENGKKECIGFTLLSLRSAHVIPATRPELQIPMKWYKLIGVPPSYKKNHPELNLSLTLRDHCLSPAMPPALTDFPSPPVQIAEETEEKQIIPVRFIEDGYIQIGGHEESEKYELKITVKMANNLDMLLPKDLVFKPTSEKFYMTFQMFGITINTKPFYRDLHEAIILNEHIVVKLQSGLEILKIFFGQFHEISINFCYGSSVLGTTNLSMEKLIPSKIQSNEFKTYYNGRISQDCTCYFQCEPLCPIYENMPDRNPQIQVETMLSTEMERTRKVSERTSELLISTEDDHKPDFFGSGDAQKEITSSKTEATSLSGDVPPLELNTEIEDFEIESHQQYSLDIILESLIWRLPITQNQFHVKFKHPRASTFILIKTDIDNSLSKSILLESLHCKFVYISTSSHITHLVNSWRPKFVLEDTVGNPMCEEFIVDTENILERTNNENSYSGLLKQSNTGEVLADIKLWICLQESVFKSIPKHSYELTPRILDEYLTIKELSDIEIWKKGIKEKYQKAMKTKEKAHINELVHNWIERKNRLECKLLSNVSRCKKLGKDLQKQAHKLKVQKALQEKVKNATLDHIHEQIRRNAIKYSLNDDYELIENISNLEMENEYLKEMLADQTLEIDSIKKCSLSNEQTTNLLHEVRNLEEKYMESLKVKNYFKEQYAKAVKEIHELKTEGHRTIQNQLQIKKDELSQLSLDKFFDVQNTETFDYSEHMLNSDIFEGKCMNCGDTMSECSTLPQ